MSDIWKSEAGRALVLERYETLLGDWPVSCERRMVETRHGATAVIDSGPHDAPPVLLLHGSVSNSLAWMGDVETLCRTHRVIAVDLIGEAGFSDPDRPDYETGAYAEWLADVVDWTGSERVALVGMSLGGWMALEFATRFPGRVSGLCLLCPGGVVRESVSFLFKAIFYMALGAWGKRRITRLVNGGRDPEGEGMEAALGFTTLVGEHFRPRTARLPLFDDDALRRLDMPVLAIAGENDYLIPPRATLDRLDAHVPQAECVLLPGTGHVIAGQASRIAAFLDRP